MSIYLIGSLRNPKVVEITKRLQDEGLDVFSEWYGAGSTADDNFRDYHKALGRTYLEALKTDAAKTIFEFDKKHIDRADTVVLVAPAGKSGHLELGYALGKGKRGFYLLDDPERWDLMLQFCTGIYTDIDALIQKLKPYDGPHKSCGTLIEGTDSRYFELVYKDGQPVCKDCGQPVGLGVL